jgi:acetolactate synthase-1/2/3 large subunit
MYTAGTAFLEALREAGIEYLFANLGSDHTALIEALAAADAAGRPLPKLITCPHEMVALSAAHGYAQASGRAQAVIVHVDCGTQSLGGAIHNAAKGRVPVLIFAGTSPATQEGEARGSRTEFIHWIQDVFDQRGLVRGYMRYDGEIRAGANAKQIVHRAMQFAYSDPKGPVYLMAAREVMEQEIAPVPIDLHRWPRIAPGALTNADATRIASLLTKARRPLIVTSYAGRNPAAVLELVRLCARTGAGVLESVPCYVNFPADNPAYQGSQWNEQRQNPALAEADVILVVDSDVPWIPLANRPASGATIVHIDVDPLKEQMPLWYVGAQHVYRADAASALAQVNAALEQEKADERRIAETRAHYASRHAKRAAELAQREAPRQDTLTAEYLTACVRRAIGPEAIVISEGVTHFTTISDHAGRSKPGTLFNSGGGSLGWCGGAALGVKLARPDATVVGLAGDGCYMFSVPSSVYWMARRYRTPFLQVIYNNRGWRAPRYSTMTVHPQGYASRGVDIGTSFDPPPDYAGIATAAGGAHPEIVRRPEELEPALQRALHAVREEGRCAVVDAWLPA